MLYEGPTVEAAIAAALGRKKLKLPIKPSTYGKPIVNTGKNPTYGSTGKPVAKPSAFGKQEDERYAFDDPQRIERLRMTALIRARAFIGRASYTARQESGIMFVYDKQTGGIIQLNPVITSFHHVGFNFTSLRAEVDRYVMLAHAHTHVKSRSGDPHTRSREDRANVTWSQDDQDHLLDFAPGFLKTPTGEVLYRNEPPFRPLREHPQL